MWGAARSGIAAANLLDQLGAEVILSDQASLNSLDLSELSPRVNVETECHVLHDADILIPSPGIKPSTPALVEARASGIQLMSEIELAASVAEGPMVAITGTDGKSTTTMMVASVINAGGRRAIVAGNIGTPFSERVLSCGRKDILVIEVSAFQLWSCQFFRPKVAVITNLAEDHLEYFDGDADAYAQSKARLLKDLSHGDTAILRSDDPIVSAMTVPDAAQTVMFGPNIQGLGWSISESSLCRNGRPIFPISEMPVPGRHNQLNALAALAVGEAFGLAGPAMMSGLRVFRGLPHRFQWVRDRAGVRWFNDSKATNPHAAAAGLKGIEAPMVLISGGYEKGLSLAPYIDAALRAKHIILSGPTTPRILDALAGRVRTTVVESMAGAVEAAARLSDPGDWVILSPAASSFDAYRSFEHRGQVFQSLVEAL